MDEYTEFLPNRTVIQIRSHAQKYFIALGKDSNYNKKGKSTTTTAYLPIMKKYIKQQGVKSKKTSLSIDIDAASKVFKRKRNANSSGFTFDDSDTFSNLSDLTYDSSFATICNEEKENNELQFELKNLVGYFDPNINEDNFFRDKLN